MSDPQSIPKGLPDPFLVHPTKVVIPLSGILHAGKTQTITSSDGGILKPQSLLSPLLIDTSGRITLPNASVLVNVLGSVSQIQTGDVFEIRVIFLDTQNSGDVTFIAGADSTGSLVARKNFGESRLHLRFDLSGPAPTYVLF